MQHLVNEIFYKSPQSPKSPKSQKSPDTLIYDNMENMMYALKYMAEQYSSFTLVNLTGKSNKVN